MSEKSPKKLRRQCARSSVPLLNSVFSLGENANWDQKIMEGSDKYRTASRSWVCKWHKRFSEWICDLKKAERSGKIRLCKVGTKSHIHDIITTDRYLRLMEVGSMCGVSKSVFNILRRLWYEPCLCKVGAKTLIRWSYKKTNVDNSNFLCVTKT
jgi:hypothetical protein